MKVNKLTVKDKTLFKYYLSFRKHALSAYSFTNIWLWSSHYKIRWALIDGYLCVFFSDRLGTFLFLPPLGENFSSKLAHRLSSVLNELNSGSPVARIENIEKEEIGFWKQEGFKTVEKFPEYFCLQKDIAFLRGNKFKHQRASYNHFLKQNYSETLSYNKKFSGECLKLYHVWMLKRQKDYSDKIYVGMLKDSYECFKFFLKNYSGFEVKGYLVKLGRKLAGFTFGFPISQETFCVLYEVTDLTCKGLSAYIFSSFAQSLNEYKYLNIMDDSGLANLTKTKQLWKPAFLEPAYIANINR